MNPQLVFIHGRSQQHKDGAALKRQWIEALRTGLAAADLEMPLPDDSVRFPYYGDTLFDLTKGVTADEVAEVIVRGSGGEDRLEREMQVAILEEIRRKAGITDAQLAQAAGTEVVEQGILNHEWVHGILTAIDRYVPHGSGLSIALFTRDVYHYLRNPGVRDTIENGVRAAMEPGVPTVVVSHSLGTVVAYNLLKREGQQNGWVTPLFVTLGSPLAVTAIRKAVGPNRHPECVGTWFNAMDERDVVALYPLDDAHFPTDPAVDNKTDVDNPTENRHGITGYLGDPVVAARIYEGLKG
jgi:hypothetical protein